MTSLRSAALITGLMLAANITALADTPKPAAHKAAKQQLATQANPLIAPSHLPFELPPFDKIRNEDYAPAFEEGMRRHDAEIAAIANSPAAPTFKNTIVAMERSGRLLDRVSTVFFNLSDTNGNATMDKLREALAPKLAAHDDAIKLNAKLFQRIDTLYQKRDTLGLDAESAYLLERYYKDFVRAGAKLSDADKEKLKQMNAELASLDAQFAVHLRADTTALAVVVDKKEDLAGLSDSEIESAALAAKQRGMEGKYVLALQNTTLQPTEDKLDNRALRQRIYEASIARGTHGGDLDNRDVVLKTVKLRAERAALLGYPNYASYALEDENAHNPQAVDKLLLDLSKPALANAKRDAADMQAIIDAEHGDFKLAAWDWGYYANKLQKQRFNFDESQLRPYFELDNVLENGLFYAANQMYGLTFKERKDLPRYRDDIRIFEVFDANKKPLALFIMDYYARDNKQGGAWMNNYVDQSKLFGLKPVIANHLNIIKPPAGQPTLLSVDEVVTMFHEFGHGLHGMFSNVEYPRFSGTKTPRDFVEFPSQFNETWALWPEILKHYAKDYKTGAPMPAELLEKAVAIRKFNQGFTTTEYIAASLVDMRWHEVSANNVPTDVGAFEADALKQAGLDFEPIPPRYHTTYFSHAFPGGYSAGYYGYLWSEILAADAAQWFKDHGGPTRKNGDWFRANLLSRGGTADSMTLYKTFRGQEPTIQPLLEKRGLSDSK